nr:hypothetical protein [uncultured Mucilaginibacter sp.]
MINLPSFNIRAFLFLSVFVVIAFNVVGQKLPNKQEGSARAPEKIKIDGKTNEWDFKAYNTATDVFYTVAHDNENIYLAVKAKDEGIVRKILSGGITFIINNTGKRSDENAATIRYPLFNYKNKPDVKFSLKAVPADSVDYVVSANNKSFISKGKFIRTAGIKGMDTLISVYNTDGISLASSFDKEMCYNYELAISRKLVNDLVNAEGKFAYKVMLNPISFDDTPGITIKRDAGGTIMSISVIKSNALPNMNQSISSITDVSGEYSLK